MLYIPYVLAIILLAIGVYAIVCKRNLIKVIIGVMIAEYAVNLFLLLMGYRLFRFGDRIEGGAAPILSRGQTATEFARGAVDPLPQALILTSIVIGLGCVALMAAMAIRLHEKYGTFDVSEMKKLQG